jgi:hypothetical protein
LPVKPVFVCSPKSDNNSGPENEFITLIILMNYGDFVLGLPNRMLYEINKLKS